MTAAGSEGERASGPNISSPFAIDEAKAMELTYSFALTYSSTFNTVGAAVVFGLFGLLILLDPARILSPTWLALSIAYFLTVLTVLYFYLRAIRYSLMALEIAKRLGIMNLAEKAYGETPGANSLLQRIMVGKLMPYGPFTRIYFIAGPLSSSVPLVCRGSSLANFQAYTLQACFARNTTLCLLGCFSREKFLVSY